MAEKEYDSKMHTSEHILNSVMVRMFGCGRSFNSHIEKKKSKCDYHFFRMLTSSEIGEVEAAVNEIISKNITVTTEFISRTEAESKYFTGKLPLDAGDQIRIVRIGSYDACPCIGPHVKATGEIGKFYVSTADWEKGILRIRFRVGDVEKVLRTTPS
jgi:misacylated tRNA(Ala) deacylase